MDFNYQQKQLGFITYFDEYFNIKITQQLIYKARFEVMNQITFNNDSIKRKRTTIIDEEEINQNHPNKRITRNNGQEFEKEIYKKMSEAGFKPIQTQPPDRGIDVIGEFQGITIYAQAKDLSGKVSANKIQQLEGVLLNKSQSIGVMVSRNGFTKEAINYAKASSAKIIVTNLETLIEQINLMIQSIKLDNTTESRVEITGTKAEVIHEVEKDKKKTVIKGAKKITIYN